MADAYRSSIRKGVQLNGIYEIDEPLATGGMGEIYRGHAIQTGDVVAIKLIRDDLAGDESALALFRREASALHSIHHEAIVRYFVFSIDPVLQRPYLAMEFVEGEPLSDILKKGPLALADILALKQRVASGLEAAHKRGIIHRDISPDNILVPEGDYSRARIIDFGIARSKKPGDATVIGSGFAGKYNYVSPEQLGLFGGDVAAASDIYSLGLVLACACRGEPLDMKGSQVEVIDKRRAVPDLSSVYPEVRPLLEWMLQPEPADRPASMHDVELWSPSRRAATADATVLRLPQKSAPPAARPVAAVAPAAPARAVRPAPAPAPAAASVPAPASNVGRIAAIGGGLALVAAIGIGAYFIGESKERRSQNASATSPPPSTSVSSQAQPSQAPPSSKFDPPAQTANLAPPRPPASDSGDKARAFLARADLGACAAIVPLTVGEGRASLQGFGLDPAVFDRFDRQFKDAAGFEADISVSQVMRVQCPAIDFVARARGQGGAAPRIDAKSVSVRGDAPFSGVVASDAPVVDLVVVDDEGQAYNASAAMRGSGSERNFGMRLMQGSGAHARRLLLLAVASDTPIASLRRANKSPASEMFGEAMRELAAHPEARAAAVSFEIE